MPPFVTELLAQDLKRDRPAGSLAGRTPFVLSYNALLKAGRSFAYDKGRDKMFCDGQELTPGVLAELRLECARVVRNEVGLRTVQDAARALGRQRLVVAGFEPDLINLRAVISATLADRDGPVRIVTVRGDPRQFVPIRDLMAVLGLRGSQATMRVRGAMRALGWRANPPIVCGHRMRGFWAKAG
jgi:hypothetical protein